MQSVADCVERLGSRLMPRDKLGTTELKWFV